MDIPSLILVAICFFSTTFTEPKFDPQVIDSNVAIGYGLAIGDVDGDRKPDILMADKKQFVWYRNGDWKRFVMVENLTEFDNVCIAARDIDGDGMVEVAVGAQWNPSETTDSAKSGSVHYLIRPNDPTQKWTPVELHHQVCVHRMKWVRTSAHAYQLIVLPLHGRGNKNGEGDGVKVIGYQMPKDPTQKWKAVVIDQTMHMTHNMEVAKAGTGEAFYVGGKEGVKGFIFTGREWIPYGQVIKGRGFGELRLVKTGKHSVFAGVEPMHGTDLTIDNSLARILLTPDLNQGHALAAADFLRAGRDQIVVGWREPNKENKVGIKIFVAETRTTWKDYWIDDNGMACEDLQVADLDGDGKKDIIASGRSTHNLKIYWNRIK